MSEKQLNFINIFDEADKEYQVELAAKKKKEEEDKVDLVSPELRKYWQAIEKDKKLIAQRQAIIRSDDEVPLTEFSPFMLEINWYIKRMAAFYEARDKAEKGEARKRAYRLVVDPQVADTKYIDTAYLYLKYKAAYDKEEIRRSKEAYQLKLAKEKEREAELKKAEKAKKAKEYRQRKKDDKKSQEAAEAKARADSEAAIRYKATGANRATGEYLEDKNDELRLDPRQFDNNRDKDNEIKDDDKD